MIIHPKKHFNWTKLSTEGGKADEGLRKRFWFFVYCGNMIAQSQMRDMREFIKVNMRTD